MSHPLTMLPLIVGLAQALLVSPAVAADDGDPPWPSPQAGEATRTLRVGPLLHEPRDNTPVEGSDLVQRLELVLLDRDLPVISAGTTSLAVADGAILTGTVVEEACHREMHWTGCQWRVQWAIREASDGSVLFEAATTSEVSVSRSAGYAGLFVDLAERALIPLARDPRVAVLLRTNETAGMSLDLTQAPSPLRPPLGPGRPQVRWIDAPGARDVALGSGLITAGTLIALPTVMVWSTQANSFDITPGRRALYASLATVGIGLGIGGGLMLRRGLKGRGPPDEGVQVEATLSGLRVRGRF